MASDTSSVEVEVISFHESLLRVLEEEYGKRNILCSGDDDITLWYHGQRYDFYVNRRYADLTVCLLDENNKIIAVPHEELEVLQSICIEIPRAPAIYESSSGMYVPHFPFTILQDDVDNPAHLCMLLDRFRYMAWFAQKIVSEELKTRGVSSDEQEDDEWTEEDDKAFEELMKSLGLDGPKEGDP